MVQTRNMTDRAWPEDKLKVPLFYVAEPGDLHLKIFNTLCEENRDLAIVPICSKEPDREKVIEAIKSDSSDMPFLGASVGDCYAFYRDHVRPDVDVEKRGPFSNWVFLVIDEAAVTDCLICTDAPDINDPKSGTIDNGNEEDSSGFAVRTVRRPLAGIAPEVAGVEKLLMTTRELAGLHKDDEGKDLFLACWPPFTQYVIPLEPGQEPDRDGNNDTTMASAHECFVNKQLALAFRPDRLNVSNRNREVGRVYFLVERSEAEVSGMLYLEAEMLASAPESSGRISHHDNMTDEAKEEIRHKPRTWNEVSNR